ncbi:bifunctional DNA-formamidopyrimidine glycosylase/DNA-(apurinic or apyrimidinic site) lyase [Patescibacteria group bacterium]|nr:bifunctional DNA-formamidopyrimidine glycosylase/DNA-(apurinic or apyrimidinic site) lyase [Patescibacteria group bacterium]
MPELPEVETIRADLKLEVLNKKIEKIKILDEKVIGKDNKEKYYKLKDLKIIEIERQGKLLAFVLSNNKYLLIHLKMTGQLVFKNNKDIIAGGHPFSDKDKKSAIGYILPNKHTRFIIYFSSNKVLFFNDVRRFGYVSLVNKEQWLKIKNLYGPEPLKKDFILVKLQNIFAGRKAPIKAILLNQKLISGLGNIYVDESLFLAKIDPRREAKSLKKEEIEELFKVILKIIKEAIKYRGTTFSDYVDSKGKAGNFSNRLKVFGRQGQKCFKCNNIIKKIKVAGRGTHVCENCQK